MCGYTREGGTREVVVRGRRRVAEGWGAAGRQPGGSREALVGRLGGYVVSGYIQVGTEQVLRGPCITKEETHGRGTRRGTEEGRKRHPEETYGRGTEETQGRGTRTLRTFFTARGPNPWCPGTRRLFVHWDCVRHKPCLCRRLLLQRVVWTHRRETILVGGQWVDARKQWVDALARGNERTIPSGKGTVRGRQQ